MQTVIWVPVCAALGAGGGWAGLYWSRWMLLNRNREEWFAARVQWLIMIAAVVCGGVIGFLTSQWIPMLSLLALLTICIAVSASDWLCRIIPNPTVLAIFALKLLLIAAALLKIPGTPAIDLLSSLGGMVFCFLVFSAPGLLGRNVGAGDIKFAAAMGFLMGFGSGLLAIVIMGFLVLGYCMLQRQMPILMFLKTDIPMGPFIAAGLMIAAVLPCINL